MLDITKLDPYVLKILQGQGWYPSRTYDISRWLDLLSQEGYVCFDYAEQVLGNLGGIYVNDAGNKEHMSAQFSFDPLYVSGEFDRLSDFQKHADEELYPIGQMVQAFAYVGKSKNFYWGYSGGFYWAGDSVEDYMNNLFDLEKKSKPLYINPKGDKVTQTQKEVMERLTQKYKKKWNI